MATITHQPGVSVSGRNRSYTFGFVFMRLSGVALVVLALGHFAIQHIVNDVHNLSLGFVAARWATLGWRIYDALLLVLALIHGLNGLRVVVDDYVHRPRLNRALRWTIVIVGAALTIIGVVTLIGGVSQTPG